MNSTQSMTWKQKLEQFLFAEEVPLGFALLRMALPLVLLRDVLARWRYVEDLYSTNGVTIHLMENYRFTNYLPALPPFWSAGLHSILVVLLVTSCIGWQTRVSLFGSLVLHTYFACTDMATSMTKFTVISTHILLLLAVSNCGRIWSIDSWLAGRRDPGRAPLSERPAWALVPVWPQRLLLIMIGTTYLGAAITKLHMPEFITGEAISYWIMSNPNFRHVIGEWMTQYPSLLIISGHFTVLWEVIFIFLAWNGLPRKIVFSLGLFFHFMAALTLGEVIFLFVMGSSYLGCLSEAEARGSGSILSRIWNTVTSRIPGGSALSKLATPRLPAGFARVSIGLQGAAFGGLIMVCGLGGAWANQQLDLHGMHRPDGPYTLPEISPDEVARLFTSGEPIREADKYLGVKMGSILVSGRLSNNCDKFKFGDIVICEASLNPPHEDMWIECHLLDGDNKIINRDGNVVARESKFIQFTYRLTEIMEPGNYTLLIRSRGQPICTRTFSLEAGMQAPVAN